MTFRKDKDFLKENTTPFNPRWDREEINNLLSFCWISMCKSLHSVMLKSSCGIFHNINKSNNFTKKNYISGYFVQNIKFPINGKFYYYNLKPINIEQWDLCISNSTDEVSGLNNRKWVRNVSFCSCEESVRILEITMEIPGHLFQCQHPGAGPNISLI